jgi:hypothetical protein
MNTPSMEVIFLILSGVILMAGILYWFWSHIQLTQKKVQLLENAVFELRGMLANKPPEPPVSAASSSSEHVVTSAAAATAPSAYKDLADDEEEDWVAEGVAATTTSTPLEALETNDLMPGGVAPPPALVVDEEVSLEKKLAERTQQESQFRELFVPATPPKTDTATTVTQVQPASLESMPVKELRRLAEERGIAGAADMRKKDILAALRSQIPTGTEERTVDISELVNPNVSEEEAVATSPSADDIKEIPIHE